MAPNLSDIKLEDIDFEVVAACRDKLVIKRYIKLLEEDGAYFVDLLNACKQKLLELDPKEYYKMYPMPMDQNEVDAVINDLLDWEDNVKEADNALRATKKSQIWDDVPGTGVFQPVRGQGAVKPRANVQNSKENPQKSKETLMDDTVREKEKYARDKSKMKEYYRAWDNFDVDGAEEELDAEERAIEEAKKKHFEDMKEEQEAFKATGKVGGYMESPEKLPEAQRRYLADSEKEKGNEAFYSKDYEEAEAYYTRSIHYKNDDPSIWANRALIRLKTKRPQEALNDCERALAVNPKYMKAWHRKGKCLSELHEYEEAVVCFQKAMALSPGNSQINGDLMNARKQCKNKERGLPERPPPKPHRPFQESQTVIEELPDDDDEADATGGQFTRVMIEEDSDSEVEIEEVVCDNKPARPAETGFQRVQIAEESDSEEEDAGRTSAAAAPAARKQSPKSGDTKSVPQRATEAGFQKVQILEESDSEEEDNGRQSAAAPAPRQTSPTGGETKSAPQRSAAPGFQKVQIVEESDSEDDAPPPAQASRSSPKAGEMRVQAMPSAGYPSPAKSAAQSPPVATQPVVEVCSFDDMD